MAKLQTLVTSCLPGIHMYYETYGTGPSVLLIHGNGGSIYGMRCQIAYFSRSYHVIAADNRAHGKTTDGESPLTYEQMADDLAALLEQLKVGSVDIIGHSSENHLHDLRPGRRSRASDSNLVLPRHKFVPFLRREPGPMRVTAMLPSCGRRMENEGV